MFLAWLIIAWLAWPASAQAGPLVGVIVGAIGLTGTAATIATAVGTLALSFGVSYIANKLLATSADDVALSDTGGVQLDIRVDADVPQSLLVGTAVTAGSLVYANTYGARGEIDNSDLIEIVTLADHSCDSLVAAFVEGQERDLGADDGNRGQVVDGYSGKLALKFYNGSQTAADAYAVAALGSATEMPWTAAHLGRSTTYVRLHSIYDRELVPGRLAWKFVVKGIKLYDPRKDTTVGGSGSHRYTDLATHEWTDNVAVIVYNVLRGIYVKNSAGARVFFYGLENTTADQLPLAAWFAAMNESDVDIDLGAGGTEKQFRAGGEITVDTEPLEAIRGFLKCCGGRLSEVGGIYKLHVGAPGLPVMAIDDGSLIANRGDEFKPILPLESRVNHITGTYTNPADGWISAVAPVRENTTWRAQDGRRISADLDAPLVQSPTQMQRLMQQLLLRSRRERRHVLPLPPQALVLEPGDVIEWTSARNGYAAKLFEIDGVDYEPNLITVPSVTEVDSTDFDWETTDELPVPDGLIVTTRPAAKVIDGFDVDHFIDVGDLGTKRPAIQISWTDPEDDDLIGIAWQIRTVASIANVTNGSVTEPGSVTGGAVILRGGLQPVTEYEVRARFISFNGYPTEWSLWLAVTTDDTRVDVADLGPAVEHRINETLGRVQARLDELNSLVANLIAEENAGRFVEVQTVRSELAARHDSNSASITRVEAVAVSGDEALAAQIETIATDVAGNAAAIVNEASARSTADSAIASTVSTLSTTVGGHTTTIGQHATAISDAEAAIGTLETTIETVSDNATASGMMRWVISTTATGAVASMALEVNVGTVGTPSWSRAGLYLDAVT